MYILELQASLSPLKRYTFATLIFVIAILLHLALFPTNLQLPFITFYPAMVITLSVCGFGPGVFVVIMSAIVGDYLFIPPHYSFALDQAGVAAICTFLSSALLIGYVFHQLQQYSDKLHISKLELTGLLEDQTELICRFKSDGTILFVNNAFCQMFGKSREALIGHSWAPVAHPEDVPMIFEKINSLSMQNDVVTITNRVFDAAGNIRWGQFINRAIFDKQGRLIEIQSVGRDITEQITNQNSEKSEHLQLQQIAASVQGVIYQFILRPDGSSAFPYASEAIRDIYRVSPEEVKEDATAVFNILHPDDYQGVADSITRSAQTLEPWKYEYRVRYADGAIRWLYGHAMPNKLENGSILWNGYITDITDLKNVETALKREIEKSKAILRNASDGITIMNEEGILVEVSDSFCQMLGYSRDELLGMSVRQWDAGFSSFEEIQALIKQHLSSQIRLQFETKHRRKDGSVYDVEITGYPLQLDGKSFVFNSSRDISERKEDERKLKQITIEQQAMLDNDLVGIVKVKDRIIIWKNKAAARIYGYEENEIIGQPTRILYADDLSFQALGAAAYPIIKQNQIYRTQIEMLRKDGEKIWVDLNGMMLSETEGYSMWMMVDITPIKRHDEEVSRIAYHDTLTNLPNRRLFEDRLTQCLAQAERSKRMLAICYLDLDGFKPVNDQFGHEAGDKVLIEVAKRMQACVRANDTVARLGGDEFVLLLADLGSAQEYQMAIARVAEAITKPIQLDESNKVSISASIGIAIYPEDDNDGDILLRHADIAMYEAKRSGRNRVCKYTAELSDKKQETLI